jgi:hypothetical protein
MKTLAEPRDKADVLQRLRALRPDSTRRWGRMTAHQAVCHLADAFLMALGEMSVRSHGRWLDRTVVKWTALYAPVRWPSGIDTSPELDQARGAGTKPAEFEADVARLEALVERFTTSAATLAAQPHSLFGRLSEAEWRRWGYLHMDHHLRQFGA